MARRVGSARALNRSPTVQTIGKYSLASQGPQRPLRALPAPAGLLTGQDDPVQSHEPSYEGRSFARPGEEIVDQGLGFDLATLVSRRRMLGVLGLGAVTVGLAACTSGPDGRTSAATSSGE